MLGVGSPQSCLVGEFQPRTGLLSDRIGRPERGVAETEVSSEFRFEFLEIVTCRKQNGMRHSSAAIGRSRSHGRCRPLETDLSLMIVPATQTKHLHSQLLLESDALYFELGATITQFQGARIASMDGFSQLAAGCVVQRIEPAAILPETNRWILELESHLRNAKMPLGRLYLQQACPQLEQALFDAGYAAKVEVGFLSSPSFAPDERIHLLEVEDEKDWQAKLDVHLDTDIGSDGYANPGDKWTAFIRRKWETGQKKCYLVECLGQIVGTVGTLEVGSLLRIKNLYIRPGFRRLNLGCAVLNQLRYVAHQRHKEALGVFGIKGSPGYELYQRCGFGPATSQTEWTRSLVRALAPANDLQSFSSLPAPAEPNSVHTML